MDLRAAVHDLRAPLNSMALNLELLRSRLEKDEGLDSGDKSHYMRYVESLRQEIARLGGMLQGMQRELDGIRFRMNEVRHAARIARRRRHELVLGPRRGRGPRRVHDEDRATLKERARDRPRELPDIVLVDLLLPDGTGIDLLRDLEANPATEIVLITGQASVDTAVEAMRKGASDYLAKPVDLARVRAVLANVVRTRELKERDRRPARRAAQARPLRAADRRFDRRCSACTT